MTDVRGQRVLVVGLGLHGGGVSAVRWLNRHGADVRVTDLRSASQLRPSLKRLPKTRMQTILGKHRWADFAWADCIYQNQGVPNTQPLIVRAKRHGIPIVNEASLFFARCPARIIGVTGTRGKSSTTALLGAMLSKQFSRVFVSGNIRQQPMLDILDKLRKTDTVVLELSSFQLEHLAAVQRSPEIAVFTNLLVDHLNRYRSMQAYGQAKANILAWQQAGDTAVLNHESAGVRKLADRVRSQRVWFFPSGRPTQSGFGWDGDRLVERRGRRVTKRLGVSRKLAPGNHQRANILAAVAAARAAGANWTAVQAGLRGFRGLPHRQQVVRRWRGHTWVNDTTATTPDGTLAALDVYPSGLFIVGGTDKQLSFTRLAKVLAKRKTNLIFLPGSATKKLLTALRQVKWRGQGWPVNSMAEAVQRAHREVQPGQTVVLSPGAASFGLFKHEFDRGDQFIRKVKGLRS